MRITSDVRRSSIAGVITLAVLLALVPLSPSAVADDDGSDGDDVPDGPAGDLPAGEWLGSFDAFGNFVGDFDGSSADVDVRVRGSLGFDVAGGSIDGEWSAWALQFMRLSTPGGPASAFFATNADGPVGGSGMTIRMTGDGTTSGNVFTSAGAQSVGPNVHPFGPLEVRVHFESCNLVAGDWITPLTSLMDTTGLTGSLDGSFAASYQGELDSDLLDRFQQLRLDLNAMERDFLETDEPDAERVFDLINQVIAMEYEVRGVGEACEFGPDLDRDGFVRFLTAAMRDLMWLALTRGTPTAENLDEAITVLLDFGIVGSGSQNQGTAAEFSGAIGEHVDRILAEELVVVTDGTNPVFGNDCSTAAPCVGHNEEARQALRAASRLGLDVEIAGQQQSAREALDLIKSRSIDGEEG
ncbi:MAG: hypothetical protein EA388_12695 [Nitriliruptor sp.]|nr:MAG: hypothetical protein EA388_12695 [Nitriliruptor sp.]